MPEDGSLQHAAVIGIDWADQKHDIALQETGSKRVERKELRHTPEAIAEWVAELRQRFGGRSVAIALETSRGPLVHALLDYDFVVLYPVNPRSLKRFRETFFPSGAKDDVPDADLLRELLLKHQDRLHAWIPDDPETRALRRLVQSRRKAVELGTRLSQQLRAALKEYFPQSLSLVGDDLTSVLACDFLLSWPTLEKLQRVRPQTLRKFYYDHNCRSAELIEKRIQEVQTATPLTTDSAIIDTSVLMVQTLARQLKALAPSIDRFDQEIEKRFSAHADAKLFESLPGSGRALAPRLLAIFGSNRERFQSAEEVQLITAIAPVTERSGKRSSVYWRRRAPVFVRQSVHEFAHHSILHCPWAKAYYQLQRERGKGHHAAVRALGFKWLRIIWRCWQDRVPYDDAIYTQALIARGSPVGVSLQRAA